ncbi:MAG TPA: Crp/Fnr family transcriptional regulator, partial [Pseudobdellovibrionaceae bacterium]
MFDKIKTIQSLELFQDVKQEDLVVIEKLAECLHIKNNETLFHEKDPQKNVYVIVYGSFKILSKDQQDNVVIFNFLGRNEVLGISMARLANPRFPVSAVANEESCVLKISVADFNKLFLKNPLLESRIQLQLAQRFLDFQEDRCLRKSLASQRLAEFILRTLDRQPQSCR